VSAAAGLLRELEQLEVVATIEGEKLRLRPASKVPTGLLADLRTHKAEVLALLTAANDPVPVTHTGPDETPSIVASGGGLPAVEWVEQMARALMANPVYRITNPEGAMVYCRGRALAMLEATPDPYARGLLLGFEKHRHGKVLQSGGLAMSGAMAATRSPRPQGQSYGESREDARLSRNSLLSSGLAAIRRGIRTHITEELKHDQQHPLG
jgi:hypothetical protein